jgi:hypothetical protein
MITGSTKKHEMVAPLSYIGIKKSNLTHARWVENKNAAIFSINLKIKWAF